MQQPDKHTVTTQSPKVQTSFSTGLPNLDNVLQSVMPGDNIVFQVDSINDYVPFVTPFCIEALNQQKPLIYFRFADHPKLISENIKAEVFNLNPEDGFENFLIRIHETIEKFGPGACYVFDCLSELAADWYTDRMLGNFFMLTCPYLYDFETATYFALLRDRHTHVAINAIHTTAQVVLDVYSHKNRLYLHPQKVWKRHTPTMYTLHEWNNAEFTPVTDSSTISSILSGVPQNWLDATLRKPDLWTRTFIRARELCENGQSGESLQESDEFFNRLLRMVVSRDERFLRLAKRFLTLSGILDIGRRMIGTGLIGGKSAGMIMARAILCHDNPQWIDKLEAHDSFYIGSDVFYTYLVLNGCWHVSRRQKNHAAARDNANEAGRRMMQGDFPLDIKNQFAAMLDYFGQSPIIVRSSSLLEDAYGNAFSGKYESVFCANQGTPAERLEKFMAAVRTVYASTMNREAIEYRIRRNLFDRDEQMALLVQRVSGSRFGNLYFPMVAGVGFSFNPYVWSPEIDPNQGILRMVFGLGTRAVDRSGDDYTRIVALNAPDKRPEGSQREIRKFAQRKVDVLDLDRNSLSSPYFQDIVSAAPGMDTALVASVDSGDDTFAKANGENNQQSILTFEKLFKETEFVSDMRNMLQSLHKAYDYPVDIEFTANFAKDGSYHINLLQCRPFQAHGGAAAISSRPDTIDKADNILETTGPIIGTSRTDAIDRLIYVVPEEYSKLGMSQRYSVARLIGKITHAPCPGDGTIMLIGPGRWGTTTPSLGVPVTFAEINTVSIICELAVMHEGLVPDVSLGTHFFNDLVETDMLYCAVHPDRENCMFNAGFITDSPNNLPDIIPDASAWSKVVHVCECSLKSLKTVNMYMNSITQYGTCYYKGWKQNV